MKNKITFILFLFLSLNAIAQDKKFSVEIGYPLSLNSNNLQKIQGLADVSLKYRFADTESITYGVSYTFDWLKSEDQGVYGTSGNQLFHHVDAFGEFKVVGAEKLHPFVGVGFTLLSQEYSRFINEDPGDPAFLAQQKEKENHAGFNINFGGSYDISSRFYVQTYFHYIRSYRDFGGEKIGFNNNLLKIGAGFRF
jgi:hypothetical protein